MTAQQVLVDDGRSVTQLRAAEYGGTPLPLIRQALQELRSVYGQRFQNVMSFVEPGSGPAPFCRVVREMFPSSVRYACDVRADERELALRNASTFGAMRFEEYVDRLDFSPTIRKLDLLGTNPPFSLAFDWADIGLELATHVLFLLPDDWHKRTKDRCERFGDTLAKRVVAQMQVSGRIAFYGGSRTDRVSYSWWLLGKSPRRSDRARDVWPTWMLRMLPAACRRWQGCRPGEEQD